MAEPSPKNPNYREFMRARRPDLYSDTLHIEESEIDRRQFEFHLHSLTSRKEETAFENFARALAEKELCPNLLPQTGPTGGGDSKVDSETYPVADSIATLWYEGDPLRPSSERWAFAVSAKAKWKSKVDSDVQKISETGRAYSLVYFISNQAIRDKDRADKEDALKKTYGLEVRILDRSWIIGRVIGHKRWQIVADTLQFELVRIKKTATGPVDVGRIRDLEILDRKIEDAASTGTTLELVEQSLESALIARSLDRPRTEIDGRFERAERLALNVSGSRQQHRIWYQRAWTAIWWFNEPTEALRFYDVLAAQTLQSEWIWDLDPLVNLWIALRPGHHLSVDRTESLRVALKRVADDQGKETSSLWARTQLLLMELINSANTGQSLAATFTALKEVLARVRGQIEFPTESVVRIIRELTGLIEDSPEHDDLIDSAIEIEHERHGDGVAGAMRLERGLQKLSRKKAYEAIDDLAKAQFLLAQEEHREQFIVALVGTGLAYESAGLLFAARANLASALDRCLYSYIKHGTVHARALPILRKLVWIELQLGRIPYVLAWTKWLALMNVALSLSDTQVSELTEETQAMDRVLGILILKTIHQDWTQLTRLPDLLNSLGLTMSRAAALFMLGHEDTVTSELGAENEDLQKFFETWVKAPAAEDLPNRGSWHIGSTTMTTAILGCRIDVIARGGIASALLGESIISFLEAFYSTTIQSKTIISTRAELIIEVRQSESCKDPFSFRIAEDDCGETKVIVTHPIKTATDLVKNGFQTATFELFARITAELQLNIDAQELEDLFFKSRAHDRAFHSAMSIVSITNILGDSPAGRAEDWAQDPTLREYPQRRQDPWHTTNINSIERKSSADVSSFEAGDLSQLRFGADAVKHRDIGVISPINLPLWDRAGWQGIGTGAADHDAPPFLALMFNNIDAGRKIFRGWQKRVGTVDHDHWIGVTVITGINRSRPMDYRIAIGPSVHSLNAQMSDSKRLMTIVHRMHDMAPTTSTNLNTLLDLYSRTGRVMLIPGELAVAQLSRPIDKADIKLGIELMHLAVVPAWNIGMSSPLVGATRGIEDPVVPNDVTDPPFLELQRVRAQRQDRSS